MKKTKYIVVFLVLLVCILFVDIAVMHGVVTRDLLSLVVHEGMDGTIVTALIGLPLRDVGSGAAIMEYALPFGHHLYVTYLGDRKVAAVFETQPQYPLRGMLLPAILLLIALVEVAVYWILKRRLCRQ